MQSIIHLKKDGINLKYSRGRCYLIRSSGEIASFKNEAIATARCEQLIKLGYDASVVPHQVLSITGDANRYRIVVRPTDNTPEIPNRPRAVIICGQMLNPTPFANAKTYFIKKGYQSVNVVASQGSNSPEVRNLYDVLFSEGFTVNIVALTKDNHSEYAIKESEAIHD